MPVLALHVNPCLHENRKLNGFWTWTRNLTPRDTQSYRRPFWRYRHHPWPSCNWPLPFRLFDFSTENRTWFWSSSRSSRSPRSSWSSGSLPFDLINWTTSSAAAVEDPSPSRAPPRSLTITEAPREANWRAYSLPRPAPAPVTMATNGY